MRLRKYLQLYAWWELTIFVFGLVSLVTLIIILFLPLASGPSMFTYTSPVPAVSDPNFPSFVSHTLTLPLEKGDSIKILNNGDEFLPAFLSDIDSARSSINIMVYIWEPGSMSDQVLSHLEEKLKQGVQVRVMLDALGSPGQASSSDFKKFKDLGGRVETFHSLTIAPWSISHNQKRDHRRAIIIDGRVAYTGGMAISDKWSGDASDPSQYRDMMFRFTGPMALDLQGIFSELWTTAGGEFLVGDAFYPPSSSGGSLTYLPLASTPSPDSLVLQKLILLSLMGAQQSIYITTPYFLPDQSFREALIEKAKQGVDVRVLVPNKYNDSSSVRHASQNYYQELLEGGVKIYEYQPTFIHTKTIVIDGSWSVIGSANMDNRSRKLNEENVFGVSDASFGSALRQVFLNDLQKSQEINLADWKKRGLWQRWQEFFALKFVQQY